MPSIICGLAHTLPLSERRGVDRWEAADIVGVSPRFFDRLVREGTMPRPIALHGRKIWNRNQIEKAFDALTCTNESHPSTNSWDEVTVVSIPIRGRFKALLDDMPRDRLNFIVGERGLPLIPESFTNGFREWVKEAGLPLGLSPHGLRKADCRRLAEAGCSANEILAISGHRNLKEVATYTQAADGQRLAQSAMATVSSFSPADERRTEV